MKNDKSIVLDLISREDEEEWFEFKENWFEAHEIGEYISAIQSGKHNYLMS